MTPHRPTSPRRGFTLIELLVVAALVLLMTTISISMLAPGVHERRMRESARMITTFLQAARTQAVQSGRSVGVLFEAQRQQYTDQDGNIQWRELPAGAVTLHQVEVPEPYCGNTYDARVTVSVSEVNGQYVGTATLLPAPDAILPTLCAPGDTIRFNYQGPYYPITAVDSGGAVVTFVSNLPNWPTYSGSGASFEIFRRPVKTVARPLRIPAPLAVDMTFSGIEGVSPPLTLAGAILTFNSEGALDRVYYNPTLDASLVHPVQPPDTVHLLLGNREFLPAPSESVNPQRNNLIDLRNLWITVIPQSGRVKVDEMATVDPALIENDLTLALRQARRFARSGGSMGD